MIEAISIEYERKERRKRVREKKREGDRMSEWERARFEMEQNKFK